MDCLFFNPPFIYYEVCHNSHRRRTAFLLNRQNFFAKIYTGMSVAVAWAAIPSPRPVNPRRSVDCLFFNPPFIYYEVCHNSHRRRTACRSGHRHKFRHNIPDAPARRPRALTTRSTFAFTEGSSRSSPPKYLHRVCFVRSSFVGPRPPVVITAWRRTACRSGHRHKFRHNIPDAPARRLGAAQRARGLRQPGAYPPGNIRSICRN